MQRKGIKSPCDLNKALWSSGDLYIVNAQVFVEKTSFKVELKPVPLKTDFTVSYQPNLNGHIKFDSNELINLTMLHICGLQISNLNIYLSSVDYRSLLIVSRFVVVTFRRQEKGATLDSNIKFIACFANEATTISAVELDISQDSL